MSDLRERICDYKEASEIIGVPRKTLIHRSRKGTFVEPIYRGKTFIFDKEEIKEYANKLDSKKTKTQ